MRKYETEQTTVTESHLVEATCDRCGGDALCFNQRPWGEINGIYYPRLNEPDNQNRDPYQKKRTDLCRFCTNDLAAWVKKGKKHDSG